MSDWVQRDAERKEDNVNELDEIYAEVTRLREDKARLMEALEAAANRIESIMETEPHLHLKDDLRTYRAAIDQARGK